MVEDISKSFQTNHQRTISLHFQAKWRRFKFSRHRFVLFRARKTKNISNCTRRCIVVREESKKKNARHEPSAASRQNYEGDILGAIRFPLLFSKFSVQTKISHTRIGLSLSCVLARYHLWQKILAARAWDENVGIEAASSSEEAQYASLHQFQRFPQRSETGVFRRLGSMCCMCSLGGSK